MPEQDAVRKQTEEAMTTAANVYRSKVTPCLCVLAETDIDSEMLDLDLLEIYEKIENETFEINSISIETKEEPETVLELTEIGIEKMREAQNDDPVIIEAIKEMKILSSKVKYDDVEEEKEIIEKVGVVEILKKKLNTGLTSSHNFFFQIDPPLSNFQLLQIFKSFFLLFLFSRKMPSNSSIFNAITQKPLQNSRQHIPTTIFTFSTSPPSQKKQKKNHSKKPHLKVPIQPQLTPGKSITEVSGLF